MKDPLDRTKVVLRRLPPAIPQATLMEEIDGRFAGRYKWFCFRPGKNNRKNQHHSRAYIDFNRSEDVVEFAEFFDGHIFVNEKGGQFKVHVEYAPSQHVPKRRSKKDVREGTIIKDPEYLEFLEHLAKPAENLPSAEIQLERREAQRAGGQKDMVIVTPLMEFVRQKRVAKSGSQRSVNGKLGRRSRGASSSGSNPSSRRSSEKRRVSKPMYVLRDSRRNISGKDKPTYILVSRKDDQQLLDKSIAVASASSIEALEEAKGVETGKKRILTLKAKVTEDYHVSDGSSRNVSSVKKSSSYTFKQNQGHETSGRIVRSILSNKDSCQSYVTASQSEQQTPTGNLDKDKHPPTPPNMCSMLKVHIASKPPLASIYDSEGKNSLDDKVPGNNLNCLVSTSEKHNGCTRNKDRPDRVVWAPFRCSDGLHADDETLSSCSVPAQRSSCSSESISLSQQAAGIKAGDDDVACMGRLNNPSAGYDISTSLGEIKAHMSNANRTAEVKTFGGGRVSPFSAKNGSHRYIGHRGPVHGMKEVDASLNYREGKPSKRGGPAGYGSHERQVWVQKSGSGT
ncbi:regulator of nonsense transcripts UPF3 isoform X1 [Elaeis guineensis]|uniref:regulator of nonsense transcripts UPF3 isoform X1 n=1 Tax=Elaeis guineensis var. tenera TaxID=51953 RepID=UPI003C6DAE74